MKIENHSKSIFSFEQEFYLRGFISSEKNVYATSRAYGYYAPLHKDINCFKTFLLKSTIHLVDSLPESSKEDKIDEIKYINTYKENLGNFRWSDRRELNTFEQFKPKDEITLRNLSKFSIMNLAYIECDDCEKYKNITDLKIYLNIHLLNKIECNSEIRNLIMIVSITYSMFIQFDKSKEIKNNNFKRQVNSTLASIKMINALLEHFYLCKDISCIKGLENLYYIEKILRIQETHIKWGLNFFNLLDKCNTKYDVLYGQLYHDMKRILDNEVNHKLEIIWVLNNLRVELFKIRYGYGWSNMFKGIN
jgi:hypothetical protein